MLTLGGENVNSGQRGGILVGRQLSVCMIIITVNQLKNNYTLFH